MLEGGLQAVQADDDVVGTSRVRELERRVCFIGNPDVAKIGTVPAKPASFAAVWFGADFQAFRQAHLDGNVPAYCHDAKRGLSGIPAVKLDDPVLR
jgi:hypothetical protein